jgi:hypothetical protein
MQRQAEQLVPMPTAQTVRRGVESCDAHSMKQFSSYVCNARPHGFHLLVGLSWPDHPLCLLDMYGNKVEPTPPRITGPRLVRKGA